MRSREALRWATTAAAKALVMERDIGALRPGLKADLVMICMSDLNLFPVHDPLLSVVEQSHSGNVDTVTVDGVVRKRNGRLLFDEARRKALGADLMESVGRLSAEAGFDFASA